MIATAGDDAQYRAWGWSDTDDAFARVRVPVEQPAASELGPIDRALLATASDADRAVLTRRAGHRVTSYDAYLADVSSVALRADVEVVRITVDAGRATGVELADGTTIDADAVVVSAGAIGSPLLLQASGIGGPHVGRHLRNHAAQPVDLRLRPHVPWNPHGLVAASFLRRDDVQLLSVNHLGPEVPHGAGFLVVVMSSTGEGSVQPGPAVDIVLSEHDRARLATGVELVWQLLGAPAFAAIVEDVSVGEAPAGVYHPTSTCRMGDVVDERRRRRRHRSPLRRGRLRLPGAPDGEHVPPDADARRAARAAGPQTAASSSSIESWSRSVSRHTSGTSSRQATKPKSRLPL